MDQGHSLIETARLEGRRVTEADLAFVTAVWNDEKVAPTIGGPRSKRDLKDRIGRWTRHWDEYGFGATLFENRATRSLVGWGGLQQSTIGIGACLTVGYVMAPTEWGHGYATEIASASVAHAFGAVGADQLFASVLSTNAASRRVLEKAGLSVRHEIDHGDHVEVIYRIAVEHHGRGHDST